MSILKKENLANSDTDLYGHLCVSLICQNRKSITKNLSLWFKSLFLYLMNRLFRRILAFFLLLTLCLPSSCALKQGIIYFFSASVFEQSVSAGTTKTVIPFLVKREVGIADCKMQNSLRAVQLKSRTQASTASVLPFLFFILPGFLISLLAAEKRFAQLPIPYYWFRRTKTPIFLQHRLLLL